MENKRQRLSVFAIAGTYVGTVVGAGFATGQEVMRFFTMFGLPGVYGAVAATALFALLGAAVLEIGYRVRATSHREVITEVTGPMVGRLLDWVVAFFLFTGAGIMMAGSGAVFAEHWGMSRFFGTVLMAVMAVGTVMLGLRGVVTSISAVAPVLVGMVLLIAGWTVAAEGITAADLAWRMPAEAASPWWPVSMLLYVAYNLFFSVSVLGPLGAAADDPGRLRLGGYIGGAALGLGVLAINLALLGGLPESVHYEVPMLHLAERLPGWVKPIYSVVLWAEIYTTAVSSLFGLTARFAPAGSPRFAWFTLGAGAGSLVVSQLGFANMVAVIFPAIGWVALIFVFALLWRMFQGERTLIGR